MKIDLILNIKDEANFFCQIQNISLSVRDFILQNVGQINLFMNTFPISDTTSN